MRDRCVIEAEISALKAKKAEIETVMRVLWDELRPQLIYQWLVIVDHHKNSYELIEFPSAHTDADGHPLCQTEGFCEIWEEQDGLSIALQRRFPENDCDGSIKLPVNGQIKVVNNGRFSLRASRDLNSLLVWAKQSLVQHTTLLDS